MPLANLARVCLLRATVLVTETYWSNQYDPEAGDPYVKHYEFLPYGRLTNTKYYMDRLREAIRRKRPKLW